MTAHSFDVGGDVDLNRLRTGLVGALATGVYHVFRPVPAVFATVVLAGVTWARSRDLRTAAAVAGDVATTWLPSAVVKLFVHRPRHETALRSTPIPRADGRAITPVATARLKMPGAAK